MCRSKTEEEVRIEFLETAKSIARYWAELPDKTEAERCDGVVFSLLNIFDGCSAGLPAIDLVLSTHEEDKQYNIDNGENWYEPKMIINDCMLHEQFCGI